VRKGQVLALIRSAELGRAQSVYLKALGEQRLAEREPKRQRRLFDDDLASRREVDEASQKDDAARLALEQALEELRVYGIESRAIAALAARGRVDPLQVLTSPVAGTVIRRTALKGARVAPSDEQPLFGLLDLSVVRIETDIPERAWQFVRAGQTARVDVDALPDAPVSGRVIRVAPLLNPESHTGKALIDIPNPREALRPGMSARVHIQTGTQRLLAVPPAAIQQEGERTFVYKALPEGDFLETPVTTGARVGEWVPIIRGLSPGDDVVTVGAFDLHSEARKSSFGGE
jgi:cobalt-zinc-cadmium efflux system membrane fusion protein